jgi:serine/threonine protein phosphatase PrpC
MHFAARVFQLAKDPEHPSENQDAWGIDPERGVAVVADGVSSAIFSGPWASILAEAVLAEAPDVDDAERFAAWLRARRDAWSERIDVTGLAWFQKAKLPLGAFSTLLWVELRPCDAEEAGAFGARKLVVRSIGDSCFFHVRHGELLRVFPVEKAAQLEADPLVLGSVDLKRDGLLRFDRIEALCADDDLLVLCTDAVAEWALREMEAGRAVDWRRFWDYDHPAWTGEVSRLRQSGQMRYDDATLVLLWVGLEEAEVRLPPPLPEPARAAARPSPPPAAELAAKLKAVSRQVSEGVEQAAGRLRERFRAWRDKLSEQRRDEPPRDEP